MSVVSSAATHRDAAADLLLCDICGQPVVPGEGMRSTLWDGETTQVWVEHFDCLIAEVENEAPQRGEDI